MHALASLEPAAPIGLDGLPDWFEVERAGTDSAPSKDRSSEASSGRAARSKPPVPNRDELLAALEQHDWVIRAVARHFDRDRRQIYRWLDQHDLRREQDSDPAGDPGGSRK